MCKDVQSVGNRVAEVGLEYFCPDYVSKNGVSVMECNKPAQCRVESEGGERGLGEQVGEARRYGMWRLWRGGCAAGLVLWWPAAAMSWHMPMWVRLVWACTYPRTPDYPYKGVIPVWAPKGPLNGLMPDPIRAW